MLLHTNSLLLSERKYAYYKAVRFNCVNAKPLQHWNTCANIISFSILVLWTVAPCEHLSRYQCFRKTNFFCVQRWRRNLYVPQKLRIYRQAHAALLPRRPRATSSPTRGPPSNSFAIAACALSKHSLQLRSYENWSNTVCRILASAPGDTRPFVRVLPTTSRKASPTLTVGAQPLLQLQ
jgi:hypothetical protein